MKSSWESWDRWQAHVRLERIRSESIRFQFKFSPLPILVSSLTNSYGMVSTHRIFQSLWLSLGLHNPSPESISTSFQDSSWDCFQFFHHCFHSIHIFTYTIFLVLVLLPIAVPQWTKEVSLNSRQLFEDSFNCSEGPFPRSSYHSLSYLFATETSSIEASKMFEDDLTTLIWAAFNAYKATGYIPSHSDLPSSFHSPSQLPHHITSTMSESISFKGRVAVVTGAGNGLGRAWVQVLEWR